MSTTPNLLAFYYPDTTEGLNGYESTLLEAVRDETGQVSSLLVSRLIDGYRHGKIGLGQDAYEDIAAAEMLLALTTSQDEIPTWGAYTEALVAVNQQKV